MRRPRLRHALRARLLAPLAVVLLALPLDADVRPDSFHSPSLDAEVHYVVDLPASYAASDRRHPVVYVLHGLFESEAFWERRGLAPVLARLRERGAIRELVVVAVDGGNSFFINGPQGRYQDLVTEDLIAHVETTHRVTPGRTGRALLGVSMGGYAALRIAFARPELFAAVATHSAMLLEHAPAAAQGAGRWHMAALQRAFGTPVDAALWAENDPFAWARRADPGRVPALFLDCGAQDRYGLAAGHRALGRLLDERGVPHTLEIPPGDHGYDFVRSRIEKSLSFLAERLR